MAEHTFMRTFTRDEIRVLVQQWAQADPETTLAVWYPDGLPYVEASGRYTSIDIVTNIGGISVKPIGVYGP